MSSRCVGRRKIIWWFLSGVTGTNNVIWGHPVGETDGKGKGDVKEDEESVF